MDKITHATAVYDTGEVFQYRYGQAIEVTDKPCWGCYEWMGNGRNGLVPGCPYHDPEAVADG